MTIEVMLDPDGTAPDWMYVVVARQTGVRYHQQYGGTASRQGDVEGFLVPVFDGEARRLLDALFVRELKGTGLWGRDRTPDESIARRVSDAVSLIRYWVTAGGETTPAPLRLDESRREEIDEAWVPVVTPDGPGVLLWPNSD